MNNVARGVDTYWLSKPLRTVFNQKHSLYLDGGTENLRWGADLSYNSGEGVMKGSFRDRMAGGLSLSYRLGSFQVRNYFLIPTLTLKSLPTEVSLAILKSNRMMNIWMKTDNI